MMRNGEGSHTTISIVGFSAVMKVDSGESSWRKRKRKRKRKRGRPPAVATTAQQQQAKERSPLTLATLEVVKEKARRRVNRKSVGVTVKYCDNTDAPYDWLPPGWIVEERFVPSGYKGRGRMYKYYYDPVGHLYRTKREVLFTWEILNINCLDT